MGITFRGSEAGSKVVSLEDRAAISELKASSLDVILPRDKPLRCTSSVQSSTTTGGILTRSAASQNMSGMPFSVSSSLSRAVRMSSRSAEACVRLRSKAIASGIPVLRKSSVFLLSHMPLKMY